MKQHGILAALSLLAFSLLLCGCPSKGGESHEIKYFAISSQDHVFSREYSLLVKLDGETFNSSLVLAITDDGQSFAKVALNETDAPSSNELSIPYLALEVGYHELEAALEDANGTRVSEAKTLPLTITPLGYEEFGEGDDSYQVSPNLWCAQEFVLENQAAISSVELHLRSLVKTRSGKDAILELRRPSGNVPGTSESSLIINATLPTISLDEEPEWHVFSLQDKILPAGTYWILLKRDDTVGNVGWTYSDEPGEWTAVCKDLTEAGPWVPVEGEFAFRIQ
ncbi:hypothetical protein JW721_03075 [Candidatus Micrarchaeota archaeon]|nr:hypothetical protein [Candidatus Micrarchaeota archaeon]